MHASDIWTNYEKVTITCRVGTAQSVWRLAASWTATVRFLALQYSSLLHRVHKGYVTQITSYVMRTGGFSPGTKWLEQKANH